ncbi:hypothetical protein HOR19_gp40 [Phage MedPE-SWcel-C56]|uniref:Tail tubular protein A n=1 Tax=Phage MedPE-SWcel-C56 TaxID=1871314 RepID=A0A1B1IY26_9CAUD|nr:hypothetical protein HOR19_gp40 [Phage MedPE-SWcel-C56]ANS06233.1 hypothetical protein [Phage MedPE-SWcel-C56]
MLDELTIINSMLSAIGVDGLTGADSDHPDWVKANGKLQEVMFSTLKLGLWFNTSYPVWSPNSEGEIYVPNGTLHNDPCDTRLNYVKRGRRLFDMTNRTFQFATGTTVKVKHVVELDLSDLPASAQDYVKHRARYDFAVDEEMPEGKLNRLEDAKMQAWVELWREHLKNTDTNALNSPQASRIAVGRTFSTAERRVAGLF